MRLLATLRSRPRPRLCFFHPSPSHDLGDVPTCLEEEEEGGRGGGV